MLSLIIPVYNEADAIAQTIPAAYELLSTLGEPFEIIVIDDGSTDGSSAILAGIPDIKVMVHPHNIGYGRAIKTGIAAAKYETIAITDADGTYPLNELPKLLSMYRTKAFDMVVGARTGLNYRESIIKSPLRAILRFLVEYTAGRKIPDINSGLRVFNKPITQRYMRHLCDTFSFTTSLTLSYMMNNHFVAYQEIPYGRRVGATKVRLFRDSLRTLQYILQASIYYNPLKIFILIAFSCVAFSLLCLISAAFTGIRIGYLLGIGGILMAMLIVALGFVAVLLKQIMDNNGESI